MAYKFFNVSIRDAERDSAALNVFLRNHRVLHVERQWVEAGENSFWAFCVDYHESASSPVDDAKAAKARTDYRETLPPDDFDLFTKLRHWRKQVADIETVPVYTVFTNEQLARIVQGRVDTLTALRAVDGVGGAKADKYGAKLLDFLSEIRHATDGDSVTDDRGTNELAAGVLPSDGRQSPQG